MFPGYSYCGAGTWIRHIPIEGPPFGVATSVKAIPLAPKFINRAPKPFETSGIGIDEIGFKVVASKTMIFAGTVWTGSGFASAPTK